MVWDFTLRLTHLAWGFGRRLKHCEALGYPAATLRINGSPGKCLRARFCEIWWPLG